MNHIPEGFCQCGCGRETPIAKATRPERGHIKGQPLPYCPYHVRPINAGPDYRLDPETSCWEWLKNRSWNGYGMVNREGHVYAHCLYYSRFVGPIPLGYEVDHLCRNRICVNPAHLEAVTPAENARRSRATKLTAEQVRAIKRLIGQGSTNSEIAPRFGVTSGAIYRIRRGHNWKDILP